MFEPLLAEVAAADPEQDTTLLEDALDAIEAGDDPTLFDIARWAMKNRTHCLAVRLEVISHFYDRAVPPKSRSLQ